MSPFQPPRKNDKEDFILIVLDQVREVELVRNPHNPEDLQYLQFETNTDVLYKKAIPIPEIIEYNEEMNYEYPQAELICWHYWLGQKYCFGPPWNGLGKYASKETVQLLCP